MLATSNLVNSLRLPRLTIKPHPEEKWASPKARETPEYLWFPFNISATAGASDFKFGAKLVFAKARHKITRRIKGGSGPGLGKLPKMWVPLQYLQNG